jgi:DNA-directed RNA polymerase specialized sigma subunit
MLAQMTFDDMDTARARDLVAKNVGLAYKLARELYATCPLVRRLGTEDDACQQAVLIMATAAAKFDAQRPSGRTGRPITFGGYVGVIIKRELRKAGLQMGSIRVPGRFASARQQGPSAAYAQQALAATTAGDKDESLGEGLEAYALAGVSAESLQQALQILPRKMAVVLRGLYGLGRPAESVRQVARRLGVSVECVERRRDVGLLKLRRMLRAAAEGWG